MKNIISFVLLFVSSLFLSCKTTKHYHIIGEENFIINDTICIPEFHSHIPGENICLWIEKMEFVETDTITIEIFKIKRKKEK
jgi:hypothetical protein